MQDAANMIFDLFWVTLDIRLNIGQSMLECYFNVPAPTHSFSMREIEGLYRDLNIYTNKAWYKRIKSKIEKLKNLISDMAAYTRFWEEGRKPLEKYLHLREPLFPEEIERLRKLLKDPNKKDTLKIQFENEVKEIERNLLEKTLEKHVTLDKLDMSYQ